MRVLVVVLLAFLLVGCGGADDPAVPSAVATAAGEASEFAREACVGSTFIACEETVDIAASLWGGSTVVICEYDEVDGEGDVLLLEAGQTGEEACTVGGAFPETNAFAVIQLP